MKSLADFDANVDGICAENNTLKNEKHQIIDDRDHALKELAIMKEQIFEKIENAIKYKKEKEQVE